MKVAVIGGGFGARAMAPVYRQLGCAVTLVASRDEAAVTRACASDADLVSIHSPPFLHRAHVLAALARGGAVLCDKPFGLDGGEARIMRDAAHAAGVPHFVNFEFRFAPAFERIAELIATGAIGRLRHVGWSALGGGLRAHPHGWLFDAAQGGGWIGAFGSHMIDMLRWLAAGEVTDCGGAARIDVTERTVKDGGTRSCTAEDAFSAWLRLDGGVSAALDTACAAPVAVGDRIVLIGSEGSLVLADNAALTLATHGERPRPIDLPAPRDDGLSPALVAWLAQVRDAVAGGRQVAPSFDDGLAAAEVMDRLRATAVRDDDTAGRR